jgi:parallel beta-helix repeat protein
LTIILDLTLERARHENRSKRAAEPVTNKKVVTDAEHAGENATMNTVRTLRRYAAALGIAVFVAAPAAHATVHRVAPSQSLQAVVDAAAPGDTILVEPGTYYGSDPKYGLRITQNNLRLIGKVRQGQGEAGKVRIVYLKGSEQKTGVYAAPAGCDYDVQANTPLGQECKAKTLQGFYIRGFTVDGFPVNGIQTRWVDGFEFIRNESVNNLNNGIYPTLSANGLLQNNVSYGSLDTAMWVAGSENVRVIGNTLYGSVIGFEITVSNNVYVTQNRIHGNTLGIGLFHPNGAGNPPLPVMANWVIEHNDVRDNNRANAAVPGTFQSFLPPGVGILAAGVSDHVIAKNTVAGNNFVGIGVLGWCTANDGTPNACELEPPIWDPRANNNLVAQNKLFGNGLNPPPVPTAFIAADATYFQFEPEASGNCFEKNKPSGFTFVSSEPDGLLPTDGCRRPAQ